MFGMGFLGIQGCHITSTGSPPHLHKEFLTSFALCPSEKKKKKTEARNSFLCRATIYTAELRSLRSSGER